MSNILTEINKENIFPDTKEEIINIEKTQLELQKRLEEQIKATEEKIKIEKTNAEKLFSLKEQEINMKNQELQKIKNNNRRLKNNLQKLQVETNKRLDKIEMKEKNELFEKEKEIRQNSLEQLLQVKEREIVNSIQIVEKKKKKMKNLENILEKNVDMARINDLYNKIKSSQTELQNLNTEKETLEKIKEEHFTCQQNMQNLYNEIEKIKIELRSAQLEKRNREKEDRKNAMYVKSVQKNNYPKKIRITKSSELPLLNTSKEYRKEKMVKMMDLDEVNEFKKKIEDIEKEKLIMDKKLNNTKSQVMEEKENLIQKEILCDELIKEEENKNKLLMVQVEEQKIEIKEICEKLNNKKKSVENKKKILEEKDEENRKYIEQVKKNNNNSNNS